MCGLVTFLGCRGNECGGMVVSGSLGGPMGSCSGLGSLVHPHAPNRVSSPGQEGGGTGVRQDDLRTCPCPPSLPPGMAEGGTG